MPVVELPLTSSEERFWRSVALRWVSVPGLVLVIVPEDQNLATHAQAVRGYACQPAYDDPILRRGLNPEYAWTCLCTVGEDATPIAMAGADVLPQVWTLQDCRELAYNAALDDESDPLYLIISGIAIPRSMPLSGWVRDFASQWPGARLRTDRSRLYCCCIISAAPAGTQVALIEGCEALILDSVPHDEIHAVVSAYFDLHPVSPVGSIHRYLTAAVTDMASGRRPHAQEAVEHVFEEINSGALSRSGWRPCWSREARAVARAKEMLNREGITTDWLQSQMSARNSARDRDVVGWLWYTGLWAGPIQQASPEQGLTALAYTALQPDEAGAWPIPAAPARATCEVLQRCLTIEQRLKRMLLHVRLCSGGRDRIRALLDMPNGGEFQGSRRDYIFTSVKYWQTKIDSETVRRDDIAISICSFGTLRDLVLDLLGRHRASDQFKRVSGLLNTLVVARNSAAHLSWFTLSEYQRYDESIRAFEEVVGTLDLSVT